jgi:hypothetical protein
VRGHVHSPQARIPEGVGVGTKVIVITSQSNKLPEAVMPAAYNCVQPVMLTSFELKSADPESPSPT